MSFLSRLSPIRAYKDLRFFLAQREPYELGFLLLAMLITGGVIAAFAGDSNIEAPYKRNIVYVEQWRADRTDAQITAQQKVDQAAREKTLAAQEAERRKTQAEFKRLDDRLKRLGI